jgi:hypothetical protein
MKASAALLSTPVVGAPRASGRAPTVRRAAAAAPRTALRVNAVAAPPTKVGSKLEWGPESWRNFEAKQQPKWPSQEALDVRALAPSPKSPYMPSAVELPPPILCATCAHRHVG